MSEQVNYCTKCDGPIVPVTQGATGQWRKWRHLAPPGKDSPDWGHLERLGCFNRAVPKPAAQPERGAQPEMGWYQSTKDSLLMEKDTPIPAKQAAPEPTAKFDANEQCWLCPYCETFLKDGYQHSPDCPKCPKAAPEHVGEANEMAAAEGILRVPRYRNFQEILAAASRLPVPAQPCEICNKPLDNGWEHGVKCGNQKACTYSEITYPAKAAKASVAQPVTHEVPAAPGVTLPPWNPTEYDKKNAKLYCGDRSTLEGNLPRNEEIARMWLQRERELVAALSELQRLKQYVKGVELTSENRELALNKWEKIANDTQAKLNASVAEVSRWKGLYEAAQAEIENLKEINHGWIKENGPGGWIDILRQSLQTARRNALEEILKLAEKYYNEDGYFFAKEIRALQSEPGLYEKTTEGMI